MGCTERNVIVATVAVMAIGLGTFGVISYRENAARETSLQRSRMMHLETELQEHGLDSDTQAELDELRRRNAARKADAIGK